MNAERWACMEALFATMMELGPEERERRLAQEDPGLAAELRALLASTERGEAFLRSLARRLAAAPPGPESGEGIEDGDALVGTRVGAYRIVGLLGRGGMASVYLAERADGHFRLQVALKILPLQTATPAARRRFGEERQLLALLSHPGIARMLDGGVTEEGIPYLVLELVRGAPITRYCHRAGLDLEQRLRLLRNVSDAVAYAHARGIVHRDLKPSNILVDDGGRPRLLDFGIAKVLGHHAADGTLTRLSGQPLTPAYASPEQLRGDPVGAPSDVYSLGVLLHELLTGMRPHDAGTSPGAGLGSTAPSLLPSEVVGASATRGVSEGAPPLSARSLRRALRGNLDAVVLRCLEEDPERRYRSAAQVRDALDRHLAGELLPGRVTARLLPVRRSIRARAPFLAAAAIALAFFAVNRAAMAGDPSAAAAEPAATPMPPAALPDASPLLIFNSVRSGDKEIWAMDPAGGPPVNVARRVGEEWGPAPSPDGRYVAFTARRHGTPDLYVMKADGTEVRRITHEWTSDLSPDWSPDGRRLAFVSNRDGNPEIYVVNADGTDPRRLTRHPGDDTDPDWSPDGTRIAFRSNRSGDPEIWVMDADGSGNTRLTYIRGNDMGPDFSPDGTEIAFGAQRDDVYRLVVVRADGGDPRIITGAKGHATWPAWSPDGEWIAFEKIRIGETTLPDLYLVRPDGSGERRLTDHPGADSRPKWLAGS